MINADFEVNAFIKLSSLMKDPESPNFSAPSPCSTEQVWSTTILLSSLSEFWAVLPQNTPK